MISHDFHDFGTTPSVEYGALVETYMISSCMGSAIYGRRDIRNHSDMIIILVVSL